MPKIGAFISHSSEDAQRAKALVSVLENGGVSCWIALRDIRSGEDYGAEIIAGIRAASTLVLLFSHHANTSKHCLREIEAALKYDKIIIPLRLDSATPDAGMEYRLSTVQWIDCDTGTFDDAVLQRIIAAVGIAETREVARLTPQHAKVERLQEANKSEKVELANPCLAAIREALRHFRPDFAAEHLRIGLIRSPAELESLWDIDNEAYGDASITFQTFRDWWLAFPLGLRVLFFENRIMGAIGIWPISADWATELKEARAREAELPSDQMRAFSAKGPSAWYISGIVLRPELVGSRAIKILLAKGLGSWLSAVRVSFPCELLALASSPQGQALLEGFGFFPIQNAGSMPDRSPLLGLEVESREHLIELLKKRGLDVEG